MPFPASIHALPKSELAGADVYVHDNGRTQVLFIEVPLGHPEVLVPTHTHDVYWGVVVEGAIDMTLGDKQEHHAAGSTHWIPAQLPHSFRFHPGTASVHYFVERRVHPPER